MFGIYEVSKDVIEVIRLLEYGKSELIEFPERLEDLLWKLDHVHEHKRIGEAGGIYKDTYAPPSHNLPAN